MDDALAKIATIIIVVLLVIAAAIILRKRRPVVMSCLALLFAAAIYPCFVIPIGTWSNGRLGGGITLLLAVLLAWRGLRIGTNRRWLRWLIQVPAAAIATSLLLREILCHILTHGHYLRKW